MGLSGLCGILTTEPSHSIKAVFVKSKNNPLEPHKNKWFMLCLPLVVVLDAAGLEEEGATFKVTKG